MAPRYWLATLFGVSLCVQPLAAADSPRTPKEIASFGTLQSPTPEAAKAQALAWYARAGGTDNAKVEAIWAAADLPLLDKVADTLKLGNAGAAKLLKEANDPSAAAPEGVPSLIKDKKGDLYLRANVGLAYAKALVNRRIFEEAHNVLSAIKPEDVVDPASYFFTKAVTDYSLMMRPEATLAALRLIEDVSDSPERYRMVSALMIIDMQNWKDNDLGWVSRKMSVIADRLDINRGGAKTRKMQKEVLVRLEEMVKEKENQQKQQQQQQQQDNDGQCPPGGQPQDGPPGNTNQPSSPQQDSNGGSGNGKGEVDQKKKSEVTQAWGNLPEKERAKAMLELTRDLPREMRESVDIYIKKLGAKKKE